MGVLELVVLPLFGWKVPLRVHGLKNLAGIQPPVIFAANHVSHLDTLAVLSALPGPWRRKVAPAMGLDFFQPYFEGKGWGWGKRLLAGSQYLMACGLVNAYPLSQEQAGVRHSLRYTGTLLSAGYSPLVYPEGQRSNDGTLSPFRSGIGFMAVHLEAPVIPIHIEGMYAVYSVHHQWPQAGPVALRIGPPIEPAQSRDYQETTRLVETAIRNLG
jgi:long-chain acyl-CoA synthetase